MRQAPIALSAAGVATHRGAAATPASHPRVPCRAHGAETQVNVGSPCSGTVVAVPLHTHRLGDRMFLLLTLSTANADVAMAPEMCAAASPAQTAPMNGATGVPLDVVPAVVFMDNGCGAGGWQLTLSRTDNGDVIAQAGDTPDDFLAELDPGADLEPETAYTLTITGSTESVVSFTTGFGTAEPHGFVPEVVEIGSTWDNQIQQVVLTASVQNGESAGQDLIVQWHTEGATGKSAMTSTFFEAAGTEREHTIIAAFGAINQPDEWCLTPSIREVNGTWNDGESACGAVEDVSQGGLACNSSAGDVAGSAAVLAGAVLLAWRGRRG